MRYFIICISLLIVTDFNQLLAQRGFKQGYIVTHKQDTLSGLIKDRKDGAFASLYKKVRYKDQKRQLVRKYSPMQILAYHIDGDTFESLWFERSRNLLKENFYSRSGAGKKVFMKVDHKDYLSLYHLEFLDQDSKTIDYIPLFKREDEDYFVRATQGILGLKKKRLAEYFSDCRELAAQIESGNIKSLHEILIYYNQFVKSNMSD